MLALAALGLVLAATSCSGAKHHRDGDGPMAALGDPEGVTTLSVFRVPGVASWSFGSMFLCTTDGEPAVIDGVKSHDTVGSGFRFAGVRIHDFRYAPDEEPILGVFGFPPDFPSGTADPIGYVVDVPCPHKADGRVIELIVGLTATSSDGGGWLGVDVAYTLADRHYVLEIANHMLICGSATTAECAGPPDASSSP
jgi:hypothetical protein